MTGVAVSYEQVIQQKVGIATKMELKSLRGGATNC